MHSNIVLPSSEWTDQTTNSLESLRLCKLGNRTSISTTSPTTEGAVLITVTLIKDCNWMVYACGANITTCAALSDLPQPATTKNVNEILKFIDGLSVCAGHPDAHYMEMAKEKKVFKSKDGKISASVDSFSNVCIRGKVYTSTVRSSSCDILVLKGISKCQACVSYRPTLQKIYRR